MSQNTHSRQIRAIVVPPIAWASQFIAIYALVSAACAPRSLIGGGVMLGAVVVITMFALVLAGWPLWPRGESGTLVSAGRLVAIISCVAILFNAGAVAAINLCGG